MSKSLTKHPFVEAELLIAGLECDEKEGKRIIREMLGRERRDMVSAMNQVESWIEDIEQEEINRG